MIKKKMLFAVASLLIVACLGGCGGSEDSTTNIAIPTDTPPEAAKLIREVTPLLEKRLPGLSKYQSLLQFVGATGPHEVHLTNGEWVKVVTLEFKVAAKGLPPSLAGCQGHHIRIEVEENGRRLFINKRTGEAVLLDRPFKSSTGDVIIHL